MQMRLQTFPVGAVQIHCLVCLPYCRKDVPIIKDGVKHIKKSDHTICGFVIQEMFNSSSDEAIVL